MKLKAFRIKNFRAYKNTGWVTISDFTGFVGKNDVGKSSVLDALDLFFDPARRLDEKDLRQGASKNATVEISCAFGNLPDTVILDDAEETAFQSEYLVNDNPDELIITKSSLPGKRPRLQSIAAIHRIFIVQIC